jgi:hypothetical protein
MMFLFHWWQVVASLVLMVSAGFFAGVAWSHSVGYDRGYWHGRQSMAWDIEEASGLHQPKCSCPTDPEHCHWHAGMFKIERGQIAKKDNSTRSN